MFGFNLFCDVKFTQRKRKFQLLLDLINRIDHALQFQSLKPAPGRPTAGVCLSLTMRVHQLFTLSYARLLAACPSASAWPRTF